MACSGKATADRSPSPAAEWSSVMRSSFVAHSDLHPPDSSSVRRQRIQDEFNRLREHAPKFVAKSNAEMSFTTTVTPQPRTSMRPQASPTKMQRFKETSTSRASFRSPSPEELRESSSPARGKKQQVIAPLKFTATSESRKAFVKYKITRPAMAKEVKRALPNTKFEAISTSHASFQAPPEELYMPNKDK